MGYLCAANWSISVRHEAAAKPTFRVHEDMFAPTSTTVHELAEHDEANPYLGLHRDEEMELLRGDCSNA